MLSLYINPAQILQNKLTGILSGQNGRSGLLSNIKGGNNSSVLKLGSFFLSSAANTLNLVPLEWGISYK